MWVFGFDSRTPSTRVPVNLLPFVFRRGVLGPF
jgi:hypothetical protein